jgi:hypothetical protein
MANLVTISSKDLQNLKGRLTKAQRAVIDIAEKEMENYGEELKKALEKEVPVRTGELKRSIDYEVQNKGTKNVELTVSIGNAKRPDVIVKSLLFGSMPHIIRPRKAKVLRFRGRGGGVVFARKVNHPGTTRDNFLYRAEKKADSARRRMISRIGALLVGKIEGGK